MRLHLLFPTAKTAVLYLVSIKSYSKNTHEQSCYQRICDKNRFYRKFYYYDISLIVTKQHRKIERNKLYLLVKKEIFLYLCLRKKVPTSLLLVCPKYVTHPEKRREEKRQQSYFSMTDDASLLRLLRALKMSDELY